MWRSGVFNEFNFARLRWTYWEILYKFAGKESERNNTRSERGGRFETRKIIRKKILLTVKWELVAPSTNADIEWCERKLEDWAKSEACRNRSNALIMSSVTTQNYPIFPKGRSPYISKIRKNVTSWSQAPETILMIWKKKLRLKMIQEIRVSNNLEYRRKLPDDT